MSAPVPFGFRSYWDLVGVGTRGLGTKGLGTGLDNFLKRPIIISDTDTGVQNKTLFMHVKL